MTDEMLSTGFQSSLRMLRQMLPSRSMLGWNTCSNAGYVYHEGPVICCLPLLHN
jgi:hypothetical protein